MEYVEGKVKKYDIKLAIHNHGPGDDLYPSAESAYSLIKNLDKRMGLCIDIGHTKRINRDPEQDVKDFFDRVFDVHRREVLIRGSFRRTSLAFVVTTHPLLVRRKDNPSDFLDLFDASSLRFETLANEKDPQPHGLQVEELGRPGEANFGWGRGPRTRFRAGNQQNDDVQREGGCRSC